MARGDRGQSKRGAMDDEKFVCPKPTNRGEQLKSEDKGEIRAGGGCDLKEGESLEGRRRPVSSWPVARATQSRGSP